MALTREIARTIAIALGDSTLRNEIWYALEASRIGEKKLHVQRFFGARGAPIANAIERQGGLPAGQLRAALAKLPQLEMYLPFPPHRASWKGTNDLLVLGTIETDREVRGLESLVAYDLRGVAIPVSTLVPPAQPALVIRTVESVFGPDGEGPPGAQATECAPEVIHCDDPPPPPADPCALGPFGTQLRACKVWINDVGQYEPWTGGSPEITAQLFSTPDGQSVSQIACANEDQAGLGFYDQNNSVWANVGQFHVGDSASIAAASAAGSAVRLMFWEDDSGSKCEFHTQDPTVRALLVALAAGSALAALSWAPTCQGGESCTDWPWPVYLVAAAVWDMAVWALGLEDDLVGMASVGASQVQGGQIMKWTLRNKNLDSTGVVWAVTRP